MNVTFDLDRAAHELYDAQGRRFDAMTRTWTFVRSAEKSAVCENVSALGAAAWLQKESEHPLRVPIGVIGPATHRRRSSSPRCASASCSPIVASS